MTGTRARSLHTPATAFVRVPIWSFVLPLAVLTSCSGQSQAPGPEVGAVPKISELVACGLQDKTGTLWFGTTGQGILRYDGKAFTNFTEKDGLCDDRVMAMLEDRNGLLWFGTQHGICSYDGKTFTDLLIPDSMRAPEPDTIAAMSAAPGWIIHIFQDRAGNMWFGTQGYGVYRYDGSSITRLSMKNGLSNDCVQSILQDKTGNIWIGTRGRGLCRYDGKTFASFPSEWLQNNHIMCMKEDHDGNIWIGTVGSGVRRYSRSLADLVTYDGPSFVNFTTSDGLHSNNVSAILEDKKGDLWFATGSGVSRYDGKTFTHFTTKEGLCSNHVWTIVEDRTGNLWFGTRKDGLCRYDGTSFTRFLGDR
ncbi:MAG: two-component regulator propeller domain-containing protein [Flavobacteriales bacterium]